MRRKQILSLFKEMRTSCPNSNSICSKVILRKTDEKGNGGQEDFELHLNWVPDESARAFLKAFILKHSLSMIETGKSLTIYTPKEQLLNETAPPGTSDSLLSTPTLLG